MTTQELIDLRTCILQGRTGDALVIIDELNGMSTKDIIRKIKSYLTVMLTDLIKNQVERRLTNSWAASAGNAIQERLFLPFSCLYDTFKSQIREDLNYC